MGKLPSKLEILKQIKGKCATHPVIVPLADTVRDMMFLGEQENEFYMLGSMGMPPSVATGIALSLKKQGIEKKVVCLVGDGGLFMNINSLYTIKFLGLNNIVIVLLDNESYVTTGRQPTYASVVNLSDSARALGFNVLECSTVDTFVNDIDTALSKSDKPYFFHVKINNGLSKSPLPDTHPVLLQTRFKNFLKTLAK